jgi:hypothetical protein
MLCTTNSGNVHRLLLAIAAGLIWHLGTSAFVLAQAKKDDVEKATGKLVSTEQKGRTTTLKVEIGGKEEEVVVNSKVEFAITAAGDVGFLKEGSFIFTEAVAANNQLFSQSYTVFVGKGKPPKSGAAKAPPAPGRSQNAWFVAGEISARQPHEQFEAYDEIQVKAGGKTSVLLERAKAATVTVSSTDLEMAEAGSTVEMEGRPGPGGKVLLTKVTVKLAKPLKAEEFVAKAEEEKKKR